jgi:tetratricopeptide (TPR) repeat protein
MNWLRLGCVVLLAIAFVQCESTPPGHEARPETGPPGQDPGQGSDGEGSTSRTDPGPSSREPSALDLLQKSAGLDTPLKRKIAEWDRAIEAGLEEQAKARRKGRAALETMLKDAEASEAAGRVTVVDLYLRGRLLGKLDRLDEARKVFEHSLTLDPEFLYGYEGQALCARTREGSIELAAVERLTDRAFRIWGGFPRGNLVLGQALVKNGRPQQALEVLDKIPPDHPAYVPATLAVAGAYGALGQPSRVLLTLQNAADRFPKSTVLNAYLAMALIQTSRGNPRKLDRAEQTLERWLAEDPNNPDARRFMADVHIRRGQIEEGIAILERLAADPDLPRPYRRGVRMQIEQVKRAGRRGPTLPELVETVKSDPDPAKRRQAASSLWGALHRFGPRGSMESKDTFQVILRAMFSRLQIGIEPDERVRVFAVRAVGYALGVRWMAPSDEIGKYLRQLLDPEVEPSRLVRGSVAAAFAHYPIAIAPLPELLKALEDPEEYVFRQARSALQRITGKRFHLDIDGTLAPDEMIKVIAAWQKWYGEWSARNKKPEKG